MERTRFIFQKVIIVSLIVGGLITVVPIILLMLDMAIWDNDKSDSISEVLFEALNQKWEDA